MPNFRPRLTGATARARSAALVATIAVLTISGAHAGQFRAPEIFLLGDSQFAFGAGPTFFNFFDNFTENCSSYSKDERLLEDIDAMGVSLMGVRSTAIHSWVAHNWKRKKFVCEPDPKWQVNARLYGWPGRTNGTYVQLGRAPDFQVCKPNRSALEVMVGDKMAQPKLMFFFFMGNAVHRWANARKRTAKDVRKLMEQLPSKTSCIVMTSVPSYKRKENRLRWKAQEGLKRAFAEAGSRCTFISGHTARTVRTYQNNPHHFRRNKAGRVKDAYHPNQRGAQKFVELHRKSLCTAAIAGLTPHVLSARRGQMTSQLLDSNLRNTRMPSGD